MCKTNITYTYMYIIYIYNHTHTVDNMHVPASPCSAKENSVQRRFGHDVVKAGEGQLPRLLARGSVVERRFSDVLMPRTSKSMCHPTIRCLAKSLCLRKPQYNSSSLSWLTFQGCRRFHESCGHRKLSDQWINGTLKSQISMWNPE